jgi:hypothetical protein
MIIERYYQSYETPSVLGGNKKMSSLIHQSTRGFSGNNSVNRLRGEVDNNLDQKKPAARI